MTLRDSIAKAKQLLNKTLQNFKDMLSDGYQKLPKAPPFNPFSCGSNSEHHHSFRVLNSLDNNFNDRLGDNPDKEMKRKKTLKKKKVKEGESCKENREDPCNGSFMKLLRFNSIELRDHHHHHHHHVRKQEDQNLDKGEGNCKVEGEEPSSKIICNYTMTAQRLKELEKMDVSNVDHLLDIEEILHYYYRITCPFYVDIVNKFFMEMYAEFLPQTLKG